MKTFFGSFFGALLGVLLVGIIIIFVIAGAIGSIMKDDDGLVNVKEGSILHLKLDQPITERDPKGDIPNFSFTGAEKVNGLDVILASIRKAAKDEKVKGIYLEASFIEAGMATVEEIRNALKEFKKSKKFIISYGEAYSQKGYYLSSVADKIYLHPEGAVDFKGLGAQVMFFKKMLDKWNIQVQIFRHGKFKSAVEPFDLEKMSESNRLQTMSYISAMWDHMLNGIAEERKINKEELNTIASQLALRSAKDAADRKFVDGTKYLDEVIDELKQKSGKGAGEKPALVTLDKYKKARVKEAEKTGFSKNKIAIVYAVGNIESGEGDDETIGSDRIAKAIREARENESIKAVVLRVNSPGGSSLASDVIWREVVLTRKKKPVIVSMGDVAASGGYYISCAADMIVAQPNTITGSIGVFGLLPNAGKMLSENIGITVDTVNTNPHADLGSVFRPVSDMEGQVVQQSVEDVYATFIKRVADGRKMTTADVDSIGQGRVWSGVDALRIGLVDTLAGLDAAISIAARKAKLGNDYRVVKYPEQKSPFDEFLKKEEEELKETMIRQNLSMFREQYFAFRRSQLLLNMKGVQARMGYDVIIE
ncbi:MAG: signal peptide peptidase SppA [Bacteroidia bacterium]